MGVLRSPRWAGPACAGLALTIGLAVAGCAHSVAGTATVDPTVAAAYKSEAASSSAAASSSKVAAAADKALSDNCDPFRGTTGPAVTKFNDFVSAHDNNQPDQDDKRDAVVQTLQDVARTVESRYQASGSALAPDLLQKLTDYVAAARALADESAKMTHTAPVGPLNDASQRVNDTLNAVRAACPTK